MSSRLPSQSLLGPARIARGLRIAVLNVAAVAAVVATCDAAHADEGPSASEAVSPPYTLHVDSDAPTLSYDAVASRLSTDLGGAVVPRTVPAGRVAISVRYRNAQRSLTVRAIHAGGRVVERTVEVQGDDDGILREAVLLAGNLARDEAREILDTLAARAAPKPANTTPQAAPTSTPNAPALAPDGHVPVTFSLFYPVATNLGRPNVRTNFELSLLYGRSGWVDGLALGSFITHASHDVDGVQIGAFSSIAGGRVSGLQMSGALSLARGGFEGSQLAGGLNLSGGPVSGAQLGPINIATDKVAGAQVGAVGISGDLVGAQVGAVGISGDLVGAQVGAVHVARDVDGAQIGVINIGRRVRGLQLGVVNIAEDVDGLALGLFSFTPKGFHPIVWSSNLGYVNAGFKFSTRYVYTSSAVTVGTLETGFDEALGITTAIGGRIPIAGGFDVDIETALSSVHVYEAPKSDDWNLWLHPRILPGYKFAERLRVFAGGGVRAGLVVEDGRKVIRPELMAGVEF